MAKKADNQTITEQSAVHMIQAIVDRMDHLWHPTIGKDSGIDGEIELRDAATGEVRNVRIGVQSKGTDRRFIRDTSNSFTFRPEPKDVSYWLSSNQPGTAHRGAAGHERALLALGAGVGKRSRCQGQGLHPLRQAA